MEPEKLAVLHDHYRDTCSNLAEHRAKRDQYFYLILLVLAVAILDISTADGFAAIVAALAKGSLELTTTPDLAFVRSVLWFLLLGLTLRYQQSALAVERLYPYVHELEGILASTVGKSFRREGKDYSEYNPPFMKWAHYLYTVAFPLALGAVVFIWTVAQARVWPWPYGETAWAASVWVNVVISAVLLTSLGLYLHAFHFYDHRKSKGVKPGAARRAG